MELRFVADKLEALVAETLAAGGRIPARRRSGESFGAGALTGRIVRAISYPQAGPDRLAAIAAGVLRVPAVDHRACGGMVGRQTRPCRLRRAAWQKAWVAVPTERRGRTDEVRAA